MTFTRVVRPPRRALDKTAAKGPVAPRPKDAPARPILHLKPPAA